MEFIRIRYKSEIGQSQGLFTSIRDLDHLHEKMNQYEIRPELVESIQFREHDFKSYHEFKQAIECW